MVWKAMRNKQMYVFNSKVHEVDENVINVF